METADILKTHKIKPTVVRMKIYDYLVTKKNHPTADTVFKSLVTEIPTLSKTSVYNSMDLFLEKNLVQAITIENNEIRFDADISEHGHFKCSECAGVYDFDVDLACVKYKLPDGFKISERILYFKGVCRFCR